jgi:ariadne-1
MTCRKEVGGCGGEWCWMCRADWKSHGEHTGGYYSCNKYEQSDGKKRDDEAAVLKARADMFNHYYARYFSHELNKKAAETKRSEMDEQSNRYRDMTGRDPKFLKDGLELLIGLRHMLKCKC